MLSQNEKDGLRHLIRSHLAQIAEALGYFEQTTHGVVAADCDIEAVAERIVKAFRNPTSYTVSDLNQVIDKFLGIRRV